MRYERQQNETDEQLLLRMARNKEVDNATWQDIADEMNRLTDNNFTESCYRKKYSEFNRMFTGAKESLYSDSILEDLNEREDRLYKQQVRARDALREYRSALRTEARQEQLIEAIRDSANRYNTEIRPCSGNIFSNGKEAALCIGDWHIGCKTKNFYNKYDLETMLERVNLLLEKTVTYCNMMHVSTLHVINLGDMIENSIHVSARVQNEIDAIEQIGIAEKTLYAFITRLAENVEQVTYRSVVDNHSRANYDFRAHIEKESFCKIIDWWLDDKIAFYNIAYQDKIKNPILFCNDNLDDNIGLMKINNKNIFYTHGHIGSQNTVTQDLTFGTGVIADIVLMGHWHSDKVKNYQNKKVYFNGSLKGVDDYALNHRLFDKPSQKLLVFNDNDVIDIPIQLG